MMRSQCQQAADGKAGSAGQGGYALRRRPRARSAGRAAGQRRGMTMLMALALVSMALALSYSVMRSQATEMRIANNSQLVAAARQTAMTGLAMGWRKMHRSDWEGVGSTLSGQISPTETYTVVYKAGDANLVAGSPADADWPYRVTLEIAGTAADPAQPNAAATCRLAAVARLAARQLAPQPSAWQTMLQYTFYQVKAADVSLELPCRLEGPLRLQGRLELAKAYPDPSAANRRYLSDLNLMRSANHPDYRPLNGPVHLPYSRTDSTTRSLLNSDLGVTTTDIPETSISGWNYPGAVSTYRIYPGGEKYQAGSLAAELRGAALGPNPRLNPAGLFHRAGDLVLRDDVTVRGTLVVDGDLTIEGANVRLAPVDLPPLDSDTRAVQLPAAIVGDDTTVGPIARATIQGSVSTWDVFEVVRGGAAASLTLDGRLIAAQLAIRERNEWDIASELWNTLWLAFLGQASSGQRFFPLWLGQFGADPKPLLTVRPGTASLSHLWRNQAGPIYVPHATDGGLRWDLLSLSVQP